MKIDHHDSPANLLSRGVRPAEVTLLVGARLYGKRFAAPSQLIYEVAPQPISGGIAVLDISVEHISCNVAIIRFNRLPKRNAFNMNMWKRLANVVTDLAEDPGVRLMILTGGAHFSAGADISEFSELRSDHTQTVAYEAVVEHCYNAILNSPKPTIAAISGVCVGGGCALALACDFRVGDATARVGIPAAKLGIVYTPLETRMLCSQVGLSNAKKVLFSGNIYCAREAQEMGFFDALQEEGNVIEASLSFASAIGSNAPLSIAAAKKTLNAIAGGALDRNADEIARISSRAVRSLDYIEGVAAFMQKRPPIFKGS